jgi:sialic acid synthase SpsE
MIDELEKINSHKHEIIIKWQLFEKAGENIPLDQDIFSFAAGYAAAAGYKTTASVFDLESLKYLLHFDISFIKIANRRDLDWLIGEIPRKVPVYVSVGSSEEGYSLTKNDQVGGIRQFDRGLFCISKYPANIEDYERRFTKGDMKHGISDHTIGLDLFKKYQPRIWEKHYKLSDSTGLDAGLFAITPEELGEKL